MSANPPTTVVISHARPGDAPSIARLAQVCHEELLAPLGIRFDLEYTESYFADGLAHEDDFVAVVAKRGSLVIGCASGSHSENWVSPDQTIFIADSWFLHPEHRKGDLGIRILRSLKKAAAQRCEMMTVTLMSTTPEASPRVLEREGFAPFEQNFITRLE